MITPAPSPRLAYGFWRYREEETDAALALLERARRHGIDQFDTADVYGGRDGFGGAERLLGALRARAPSLFEGATLATKAGVERGAPYNSSAEYLTQACEASLARLGVEQIDLFYIHRPDLLTHPAELAATLDQLVSSGKVTALGVSNFTSDQIDALVAYLKTPLAATQIEISAAHAEPMLDGVLEHAMTHKLDVLAWSPLAGGRLGSGDSAISALRTQLDETARHHGASIEAVALAFLLRHPARIVPILGTKTIARLDACVRANDVSLTRSEWYAILEASLGRKMP